MQSKCAVPVTIKNYLEGGDALEKVHITDRGLSHLFTRPKQSGVRSKFLGGKGWWMRRGVAVKDAWSRVVGVGVIKGSFQKHLKTGGG